ncbi:MAG: hypothetical protein ACXWLH_02425 [Candidatus Saccharimonadales bacterium]
MTATNHAMTGALIGLTLHQPWFAVPAAFASHYVLDAIPHADGFFKVKSLAFRRYLLIEALLCAVLVAVLAFYQPAYWWLAAVCAFAAASPDFMWIKAFILQQRGRVKPQPKLWLVKLHGKVQWFAKPIGAVVELAWAATAIALLAIYIKK